MVVSFLFSDRHLDKLKTDLKKSNRGAYADGSRRNLRTQWESFLLFCFYFHLRFLPVSTETLQLYAQFLSRSFKSVEAIKNYISGVRTLHQLMGVDVSSINGFLLNLTFKGISKTLNHAVHHATPISPLILKEIYFKLDMSKADDIMFWCLFVFAFFLLSRKSNLVPTKKKDLQLPKFLLRKDVSESDNGLIVNMKWSKTIQAGQRILSIPLTKIPDCILCPVAAYHNMIKMIPGRDDSPLFLLESGKPVFYRNFNNKLREVIKLIGLNEMEFSTHSFRRGFATFAFHSNINSDLIQLMGDWKSDAYKKYLEYDLNDKIRVSKLISTQIVREIA